jgi:hypothetical protein
VAGLLAHHDLVGAAGHGDRDGDERRADQARFDAVDHLGGGQIVHVDDEIGDIFVERPTLLLEVAEHGQGVGTDQRTVGAPSYAARQQLGASPQPHDRGPVPQASPVALVENHPSAGRHHDGLADRQHLGQHLGLQPPEGGLPVVGPDLRHRAPGPRLHLAIAVAEVAVAASGEGPAHGRLARAHHAHQDDGRGTARAVAPLGRRALSQGRRGSHPGCG